ncbi:MAG: RNA 2',3'-cyclic phosphodiesterase [Planctomycetota bacterium]
MIRAFAAVALSPEIVSRYASSLERDRGKCPRLRWVRPENLHLTLRFLGDTSEGRIEPLRRRLVEVARPLRPFRVSLGKPGSFGRPDRPQVLWFSVGAGAAELESVARAVESAVVELGFPPEDLPWRAHVTVARNPARAPWSSWESVLGSWGLDGASFEARELTLFSSRLGPGGPAYTALGTAPFEGGTG